MLFSALTIVKCDAFNMVRVGKKVFMAKKKGLEICWLKEGIDVLEIKLFVAD